MIDRVHQHGDAERVRQQDEFLALVVAHMAGAGEKIDAVFPFLLGRAYLTYEGMQVPHQSFADFPDARSGCARDPLEYRVGDGVFVEVTQFGLR
jgi:hypothetical protein